MWQAIFGIAWEVMKFLCKAAVNKMDVDERRRKERDVAYEDVRNAKSQHDRIRAIAKFNAVR